jgi:hypothetical protein
MSSIDGEMGWQANKSLSHPNWLRTKDTAMPRTLFSEFQRWMDLSAVLPNAVRQGLPNSIR